MIRFFSPRPRLRALRLTALVLFTTLAACAEVGHYDNAGYHLPGEPAELVGTTVVVTVMPREQLGALARQRGMALRAGHTVSGLSVWNTGSSGCVVYLAADTSGLAALEHELWHCKVGHWHD